MKCSKNRNMVSLLMVLALLGLIISGCTGTGQTATSPHVDKYNGNFQVKVTDLSGNPLQGAKVVSEEEPDGQLKVTGLTDVNGIVIFKDIKSGKYKFYISRYDYFQKTDIEVIVTSGQTTDLTVNMTYDG